MCLLATRKPHFCISESCISNQTPNTFTHSEPWERVLAGSVVQTELLFRTTELSNIYCLVKVSVRNYDISRQHRSSSAKGGISHFPLRPALSEPDQRTVLSRKTAWTVDGEFVFGWFSLKLQPLKKMSDLKGLLKAILIFLVWSSWCFVHCKSFILVKAHLDSHYTRLGSHWWNIH